MNKKVFFLLTLFSTAFISCDKEVNACMELSETSVSVGTEIEFLSCSENALSLEWFIDGPEEAPENDLGWSDIKFYHAFEIPGEYVVTLHAYENFSFMGTVSTIQETITIN